MQESTVHQVKEASFCAVYEEVMGEVVSRVMAATAAGITLGCRSRRSLDISRRVPGAPMLRDVLNPILWTTTFGALRNGRAWSTCCSWNWQRLTFIELSTLGLLEFASIHTERLERRSRRRVSWFVHLVNPDAQPHGGSKVAQPPKNGAERTVTQVE